MQPECWLWIESTDLASDDFYASYPLEVYVVLFTNLDIYLMDLLAFNRQIGNVYVRQGYLYCRRLLVQK